MNTKCIPPSSIKRQQGWTFWSLLFTMSVIMFFAFIGMQLVPVYSSNGSVVHAMNQSLEDIDLSKVTRTTVVRKLDAQLYLDGSHEILDYKTDLEVRRTRDVLTLETHYQRAIPLFYNLSLVVQFDNVVERELAQR